MRKQSECRFDDIQERIGALERQLFLPASDTGQPRKGIRISDWYLPIDLAWRILLSPGELRNDSGFLLGIGRAGLIKALLVRRRYPWRLRADAFVANRNCRAFYLADKLTVKGNFSIADGNDPIQREIVVRQAVITTERIQVPEILRHGTLGSCSYFVERILTGAVRLDPDKVGTELAEALFEFYAKNGMISKPLALATSLERSQEIAAEIQLAAGIAATEIKATRERIANIFARSEACAVLMGLCHGDLSIGNMLRLQNRIFLLDWEEGHQGPIYGDLHKLFAGVPGFEPRFDALTREFCGGDSAITAQKLLADLTLGHRLWQESRSDRRTKKLARLNAIARTLVARCKDATGK